MFCHFGSLCGDIYVLVRNFVSESSRAGVNHDDDLVFEEAESFCE